MLRRFFYRQFRLTARVQWWLGRRLTPAGRLVAGALVAALVFGPNTRLTVGYQAFTLLLALLVLAAAGALVAPPRLDRKSTRLNSSHSQISYAVFCLKK